MTTRAYAFQQVVSQGLLKDKTALAAFLDLCEAEGRQAAAADGHELGPLGSTAVHRQVWVERWSKEGGAYVAPAIARAANVIGVPAGAIVRMEWPIVDPAAPAELAESDHGAPGQLAAGRDRWDPALMVEPGR